MRAKKCTKNPIAFLPFSLPSPTSLLKLPITVQLEVCVGRVGGGEGKSRGRRENNLNYIFYAWKTKCPNDCSRNLRILMTDKSNDP